MMVAQVAVATPVREVCGSWLEAADRQQNEIRQINDLMFLDLSIRPVLERLQNSAPEGVRLIERARRILNQESRPTTLEISDWVQASLRFEDLLRFHLQRAGENVRAQGRVVQDAFRTQFKIEGTAGLSEDEILAKAVQQLVAQNLKQGVLTHVATIYGLYQDIHHRLEFVLLAEIQRLREELQRFAERGGLS